MGGNLALLFKSCAMESVVGNSQPLQGLISRLMPRSHSSASCRHCSSVAIFSPVNFFESHDPQSSDCSDFKVCSITSPLPLLHLSNPSSWKRTGVPSADILTSISIQLAPWSAAMRIAARVFSGASPLAPRCATMPGMTNFDIISALVGVRLCCLLIKRRLHLKIV